MSYSITLGKKDEMARVYAFCHSQVDAGLQRTFRLRGPAEKVGDPNAEIYMPTDASVKLLEVTTNKADAGIRPITFSGQIQGFAFWPTLVLVQVTPQEFQHHEQDMRKLNNTLLPQGLVLAEEVWRR